jgi:hypothetical protein
MLTLNVGYQWWLYAFHGDIDNLNELKLAYILEFKLMWDYTKFLDN